jgi:hypothetical protein
MSKKQDIIYQPVDGDYTNSLDLDFREYRLSREPKKFSCHVFFLYTVVTILLVIIITMLSYPKSLDPFLQFYCRQKIYQWLVSSRTDLCNKAPANIAIEYQEQTLGKNFARDPSDSSYVGPPSNKTDTLWEDLYEGKLENYTCKSSLIRLQSVSTLFQKTKPISYRSGQRQ